MGSIERRPTQPTLLRNIMLNPQFTFRHTQFSTNSFWDRRRRVVRSSTLQTQLDMLRKTGRYDAFDLEWHPSYNDPPLVWPVPNHLFWESDIAKWIEGACYFLMETDDIETRTVVEDLVGKIRKAQRDDGYLNIHFTVVEPEKKFTNLRDMHELYNAGHLIEAALIHHEYFGNNDLLDPLLKHVHLLHRTFGPGSDQIRGYPGHPEIELALLRLWRATGDSKSLELARFFIEERGNPTGVDGRHYYDVEADKRGDRPYELPVYYPKPRSYWYQQAHKPLLEQQTVEGHAVRAMYLLTAVADLALIDRRSFGQKYMDVARRLWDNMVDRKMYLTGGIGAIEQWEGFGLDYFLPQGSSEGGCYSETCAAIGVMMVAERMLQLDLDSKYADVLELCLYNAVLTGMSLDGKAFTYDNQLASSPSHLSKREEWFECACCPPNVSRVLGYLGGYVWTLTQTHLTSVDISTHLYTSATLASEVGGKEIKLTQQTDWPWNGEIEFEVSGTEEVEVTLRLRIPQWAETFEITPAPSRYCLDKGYLTLPPTYVAAHPSFRLSILIKPRIIRPHPYTNQPIAAVARGPIIYCVEDVDNSWVTDHFQSVVFDESVPLIESERTDLQYPLPGEEKPLKESYIAITAENGARFFADTAKQREGPAWGPGTGSRLSVAKGKRESLRFVPYFARANRGGRGMMRVGLRVGSTEEV